MHIPCKQCNSRESKRRLPRIIPPSMDRGQLRKDHPGSGPAWGAKIDIGTLQTIPFTNLLNYKVSDLLKGSKRSTIREILSHNVVDVFNERMPCCAKRTMRFSKKASSYFGRSKVSQEINLNGEASRYLLKISKSYTTTHTRDKTTRQRNLLKAVQYTNTLLISHHACVVYAYGSYVQSILYYLYI